MSLLYDVDIARLLALPIVNAGILTWGSRREDIVYRKYLLELYLLDKCFETRVVFWEWHETEARTFFLKLCRILSVRFRAIKFSAFINRLCQKIKKNYKKTKLRYSFSFYGKLCNVLVFFSEDFLLPKSEKFKMLVNSYLYNQTYLVEIDFSYRYNRPLTIVLVNKESITCFQKHFWKLIKYNRKVLELMFKYRVVINNDCFRKKHNHQVKLFERTSFFIFSRSTR